MDIFVIAKIECNMSGKIQKVCGLNLGAGDFTYGITGFDGCIPVNEETAHKIAHKCEAGAVDAFMCFAAPAVLCTQIGQGVVDDAGTQFCVGSRAGWGGC